MSYYNKYPFFHGIMFHHLHDDKTYKDSQICKICTEKYSRSTSKMESYSLFHNTFDNTLSKEDIKNDLSIQTGYNSSIPSPLPSSISSPFPILTKNNGSNT